jgi:hypothetical protein
VGRTPDRTAADSLLASFSDGNRADALRPSERGMR